jgi:hypothetical protein
MLRRKLLRKSVAGQKLAANEKQHDHACFYRDLHLRRFSLHAGAQRLSAIARAPSSGCKSHLAVGAPQFGQRCGFYGTIAYDF